MIAVGELPTMIVRAGRLRATELPRSASGLRELRSVERLSCGLLSSTNGGPLARPRRDDRPEIGARSCHVPEAPGAAYDACEKVATRVSSLSLVRYRLNDYSVPTTYGHRDVLVRGYVDDVVGARSRAGGWSRRRAAVAGRERVDVIVGDGDCCHSLARLPLPS